MEIENDPRYKGFLEKALIDLKAYKEHFPEQWYIDKAAIQAQRKYFEEKLEEKEKEVDWCYKLHVEQFREIHIKYADLYRAAHPQKNYYIPDRTALYNWMYLELTKPKRKLIVAELRELLSLLQGEKITFSRMVEIINEKFNGNN